MTEKLTSEDILKALNTHYCESIFITDGEGKVIFVNELGAERMGTKRENLMNRNVREFLSEGMYERSTTLTAIETKQDAVGTLNPDDDRSSVSHSVPVLDDNGDVIMVVTNNMNKEHSREWEQILKRERQVTERLRRELDNLRDQEEEPLIAHSPQMQKIYSMINVIAPTDSNVIILGESGTGKDVMARYIHDHSGRSDKAFISVNCAALPEQLLESELFGYEAGAFTGALSKGKIGLFEAASGGTLFLDEIGEMPLALQSKLLRALENHEIRRVGGVKNIPIDARIICATNANLQEMIKEKTFRGDLYYRLSVFTLNLPPLRERKEDIIPLAEVFLKKLNQKYGTDKILADVSIDTMKRHNWPGNIRELKNVVERIFVVSKGRELIFTPTPTADIEQAVDEPMNYINTGEYGSLKEYMDEMERLYIAKVMAECNGSVNESAKKLGIHRSVLYRKNHKDKNENSNSK